MGDAASMGDPTDPSRIQRRDLLQAGALASAAALTLGSPSRGDEPKASKPTLPTRKLGNTGVDVTILNQGTWRAPDAIDRILRFSYANGVRYFDTAKSYGSEPGIAKWMQAVPEVRKDIFLVTKDSPRTPSQMMHWSLHESFDASSPCKRSDYGRTAVETGQSLLGLIETRGTFDMKNRRNFPGFS